MSPRRSWSLDWLDLFSHLLFDPWFMGMLSHGLEQGGCEGGWKIERRATKRGGDTHHCNKRAVEKTSEGTTQANDWDLITITLFSRLGRMPISVWVEYIHLEIYHNANHPIRIGVRTNRTQGGVTLGYAVSPSDSASLSVITANCHMSCPSPNLHTSILHRDHSPVAYNGSEYSCQWTLDKLSLTESWASWDRRYPRLIWSSDGPKK